MTLVEVTRAATIKGRDKAGSAEAPSDDDVSVLSERTMDEIAASAPAAIDVTVPLEWHPARLDGVRKRSLAHVPKPQMATLSKQAPTGDDSLHEIKFDGYRILVRLDHGEARLPTRNGKNWGELAARKVIIMSKFDTLPRSCRSTPTGVEGALGFAAGVAVASGQARFTATPVARDYVALYRRLLR